MKSIHSIFPDRYPGLVATILVWSAVLSFSAIFGAAHIVGINAHAMIWIVAGCALYGMYAWRVAGHANVSPRWRLHLRIVAGVVLIVLAAMLLGELNYQLFARGH